MLPLLLAASLAVAQAPDSAHVVLVATADVHGRATGWDYLAGRPGAGGLARVAPVVDSLRGAYPGRVVVLDAGDLLQGEPFATYHARVRPATPHPVVEAMNLVGYDAATPGNHDFDFGVPVFERAVADARFPFVSANLYALPGDTLMFPPLRVLRRDGVRVGVAGFTTPGTMVWNRDQLRGRVRVGRVERSAETTLAALRRQADVSVVLMHGGLGGAATYDTTDVGAWDAADFAALPFRPDVVVLGHSHREIADTVVNGVHFVQPRPRAEGLVVVHVHLRRVAGRWGVARIRGELVPVGGRPPSELLARRLSASHAAVQTWVNEPIGLTAAPMSQSDGRARPTALHDFVLETMRRRAGADLAGGPVFDLHAGFPDDTIRRGQVLALYPYDNTLRAVRLSGAQLRAYLERSTRLYRTDAAGRVSIDPTVPGYEFDVVRGAGYDIDLRQPVGERIRNLTVRGRPLGPADSVTLALSSHRQAGGGGHGVLREAPVVYDRGEHIPDLLVEEIRRLGTLDPAAVPPSEWRIVPDAASQAVRRLYDIAPDAVPPSPRDRVLLRIVATADLHGDLLRHVPVLARAMDSLAADCDCPDLRVDAGDALQGGLLANLTAGRSSLAALDQLGYDAAVPGDRDFDWSPDTLRARTAESRRLWVAANVFDSVSGRHAGWLRPFGIIDAGELRIAVIGYITPETKAVQPADRTRGLRFGAGELALHAVLAEVARARPDLTVLLAHERAACDGAICQGELIRLAEQLAGSGVDLIVAGHASRAVDAKIGGIPVVGPGGAGSVAVVDVIRTSAGGRSLYARVVPIAEGAPPLAALLPLQRRADSLIGRPLAQLKRPLRGPTLGAMVAEARRNATRADLGLVRTGDIVGELPAGPVTYQRLAAVEPAEEDLVVLTLTGAEVREVLERALAAGAPEVYLAGATVRFDPRAKPGRRVRQVVLLGGRRLDDRQAYTLATDAPAAATLEGLRDGRAERRGMIDVEAVAGLLRRLPQPVEFDAVTTFQSTRR